MNDSIMLPQDQTQLVYNIAQISKIRKDDSDFISARLNPDTDLPLQEILLAVVTLLDSVSMQAVGRLRNPDGSQIKQSDYWKSIDMFLRTFLNQRIAQFENEKTPNV